MKRFFWLCLVILSTSTFADVELITRYHPEGSYSKGAYSFYFKSQNAEVTLNNFDILFEDREDFEGYFTTEMVVDHVGKIADLGKKSCKDIESDTDYNRQTDSYRWLYRTDAFDMLSNSLGDAKVKEGHCYLIDRVDSDQRVLALFHVKKYVPKRSVILDEIEVMARFKLKLKR